SRLGDAEPGNGRAEMRVRVVPKLGDERMSIEDGLDDGALHAAAAPVHEPDPGACGFVGGRDVVVDDGRNVGGRKGVQIELVLDPDLLHARENRAMTFVVMP